MAHTADTPTGLADILCTHSRAGYVTFVEVAPTLPPALGRSYALLNLILVPTIALLFLRLYFLPASQSVPPHDPPAGISDGRVIFECLSPAEAAAVRASRNESSEAHEDKPLVNRCWRGRCNGRWKPARARHCSDCGTCRAGFDHHCAFFANCLTVPYIPTFLLMLILTAPTVIILSLPLYRPLAYRAVEAYHRSWSDDGIVRWWYAWKGSWVVAGGPVGRYVGGIVLGWKALDRVDGGGTHRLEIGVLVGVGAILGMITTALAVGTISLVLSGQLTIDRERARSHSRARMAITSLLKAGKPVPPEAIANMERWGDKRYFFVPSSSLSGGVVVETLEGERPYDMGREANWEMVMGKGWGWVLPWRAMSIGLDQRTMMNWPITREVEKRLKAEVAGRTTEDGST